MPNHPTAPVAVVVAPSLRHAVPAALLGTGNGARLIFPSPVVIAAANRGTAGEHGLAPIAQSAIARTGSHCRIEVAPDFPGMSWRRMVAGSRQWAAVDLGRRGERLSSVTMSAAIARAATVIGANDLRDETGERPTIAIGLWSRFAGWRERIGARASTPEQGVAAEIALAARPSLILLADEWRGLPVVVAATDQIAAELAGLALKQMVTPGGEEEIGPWQDPLVQRATELDLGVRVPDQIALRGTAIELDAERTGVAFAEFVATVAGRLGVRDFAVAAHGGDETVGLL
jgi:hypothetical protein